MKKLLYTLLAVSIIFSACQKDEDPTTVSTDYITDCNVAEFDITFSGTNLWDSDNGWFSIDGTESYCSKTIDPNSPNINNPSDIDFEVMNDSDLWVENQPDGTKNLNFWFEDSWDWDIFRISFNMEDVDNIPIGQAIQINADNVIAYISYNESFNCDISITFTTIDIANHIYEGNMSCSFSPSSWVDYPQGTNLNFTATINNFHFGE
jgi:hypothetical protein